MCPKHLTCTVCFWIHVNNSVILQMGFVTACVLSWRMFLYSLAKTRHITWIHSAWVNRYQSGQCQAKREISPPEPFTSGRSHSPRQIRPPIQLSWHRVSYPPACATRSCFSLSKLLIFNLCGADGDIPRPHLILLTASPHNGYYLHRRCSQQKMLNTWQ